MRAVADTVAHAESEELAVAGVLAILRAKLGWSNDSEARSAIQIQFAPVAKASYAGRPPEADEAAAAPVSDSPPGAAAPDVALPDVLGALATFEAWYDSTHPAPFWTLFEQPMPETPLVDF
jgi:hypothetical protein